MKDELSNLFINQGKGPLEVLGRHGLERQKTKATQKILKVDGSTQNQDIGEFIFHSGHDHWHIENYTIFELWSLKDNNRDKLLATTNKMSFCLWDEQVYDLTLENASQVQKYVGCNNEVQGVSVGWSDTYDATAEGQELDLSNVSDGVYLVRSVINPDKKILESDYSNNEVNLRVEIRGESLVIQNVV